MGIRTCAYIHIWKSYTHVSMYKHVNIIVAVLIRIQYKPSKITCFASILSSLAKQVILLGLYCILINTATIIFTCLYIETCVYDFHMCIYAHVRMPMYSALSTV